MAFQVRLEPSGHEFIVHENESILEAGLRAGFNMRYQCDIGSCGACQARLLEGDIKSLRYSEFVIPEASKVQGYFLPCSMQAASDIVIECEEDDLASDMPYQEVTARVRKMDRINEDLMILHLRTPRTRTLRFLAGQNATLEVQPGCEKTLEIASCPCNGMMLEFHLRRGNNPFDRHAFDVLAVNQIGRAHV